MDKKPTPEELRKRHEEAVEQSIAAFPYQKIEAEAQKPLQPGKDYAGGTEPQSALLVHPSGGLRPVRAVAQ
jgi:hypothetical protein